MPEYYFLPFGKPLDWNSLSATQKHDIETEQNERLDWYRRVNAK